MNIGNRVANSRLALVLLLPVAADMLWLYLNPPADRRVNPFFLYLVFFGIGGLVVSIALVGPAKRLSKAVGAIPTFVCIGLALCIAEETVAYATRSGIYQDGLHSLLFGLIQAGVPLFLWTLGVLWVIRMFAYPALRLYVVVGISGWLCEAIIGGLFFRDPALAVLVLPAVAYSYFVLIYLPHRAVEGSIRPGRSSGWSLPAGIAVPALLWLVGGVIGALTSRALGL